MASVVSEVLAQSVKVGLSLIARLIHSMHGATGGIDASGAAQLESFLQFFAALASQIVEGRNHAALLCHVKVCKTHGNTHDSQG
jgi:hypothetical protein